MQFPALDAVESKLKQAFAELGDDMNFANLTCIKGTTDEQAAEIRRLNDERERLLTVLKAAGRGGDEAGTEFGDQHRTGATQQRANPLAYSPSALDEIQDAIVTRAYKQVSADFKEGR